MAKTTKILPNPNSEINILRAVVTNIVTQLNNYLIASNMDYRYKLTWQRGEGEVANGEGHRTNYYFKLDLSIEYNDGSSIPLYGGNYPLQEGTSMLRLTETECKAYKDMLKHGVGHLISVQHSSFLMAQKHELEQMDEAKKAIDEAEAKKNKSNLIL